VLDRHGTVYIARRESGLGFDGYWDQDDPPTILEQGPGWDDVDEAITWGRLRADRVLVRLGVDEGSIYSAGDVPLTRFADGSGAPYPEWPPLRGHS
jgi:hypothetical protein